MFNIIIFSFLIMLASLAGVVFTWKSAGKFIEKHLKFLVSFSAGVFLVISLHLAQETVMSTSLQIGLLWVAVGAVGIFLLFRFLPAFHHHHDEHEEDHQHTQLDARRILTGDALHNIGDGILLTAAFSVNPVFGAITASSIFIHELVQEISEFFVLRQAGFSTKKALGINFLVSATILIGSVGGYLLLENISNIETPLLGVAAGAFLVVVLHDLIPHSVRSSTTRKQYLYHVVAFTLGTLMMLGVNTLTAHTHDESHEHNESRYAHEEEPTLVT